MDGLTLIMVVVSLSGEVRQVTGITDLRVCRDLAQTALTGRSVEAEYNHQVERRRALEERAERIASACKPGGSVGQRLNCTLEENTPQVPPDDKPRARYARCLAVPEALPPETPLPPPRPTELSK